MGLSRFSKYIASGLVLGIAGFASAALVVQDAPPPPDYKMSLQIGDGYTVPMYGNVTSIDHGSYWTYQIDGTYSDAGYAMSFHVVLDPDPSVLANINLQNNTPITQNYLFTVLLPVAPGFTPSQLAGSVGLTVTNDTNGSATAATIAPDALYTALIDGVAVQTLKNNPYSLTVPLANDTATDSAKFGIPTPIPGGGVNTNIAINLRLSLTAGDQAALTSIFTVNPVPEPALMTVFALAGLALASRRRK